MRQTSLSPSVPRVSWKPGYVNFVAHRGEAAGVWVVPWPQFSRNVGAGLETSSAWGREVWLCSTKNYLLLLLSANSRHSQFKMHIKPCSIAGTFSAARMCCQTHWEVSCLMRCSIPDKNFCLSLTKSNVEFCIYWLSSFPGLKYWAEKSGLSNCL